VVLLVKVFVEFRITWVLRRDLHAANVGNIVKEVASGTGRPGVGRTIRYKNECKFGKITNAHQDRGWSSPLVFWLVDDAVVIGCDIGVGE